MFCLASASLHCSLFCLVIFRFALRHLYYHSFYCRHVNFKYVVPFKIRKRKKNHITFNIRFRRSFFFFFFFFHFHYHFLLPAFQCNFIREFSHKN